LISALTVLRITLFAFVVLLVFVFDDDVQVAVLSIHHSVLFLPSMLVAQIDGAGCEEKSTSSFNRYRGVSADVSGTTFS
jgi:hypothetical protein